MTNGICGVCTTGSGVNGVIGADGAELDNGGQGTCFTLDPVVTAEGGGGGGACIPGGIWGGNPKPGTISPPAASSPNGSLELISGCSWGVSTPIF